MIPERCWINQRSVAGEESSESAMEETMQAIKQIDLEQKPIAIAKLPDEHTTRSLLSLLMGLAEARQTTVSPEGLKLYTRRLSSFPLSDVKVILQRISQEPRAEGETAFPALPDIEAMVRQYQVGLRVQKAREERERSEAQEFDIFLRQRMSEGESKESILQRFPSLSRSWQIWRGELVRTEDQKTKASGA